MVDTMDDPMKLDAPIALRKPRRKSNNPYASHVDQTSSKPASRRRSSTPFEATKKCSHVSGLLPAIAESQGATGLTPTLKKTRLSAANGIRHANKAARRRTLAVVPEHATNVQGAAINQAAKDRDRRAEVRDRRQDKRTIAEQIEIIRELKSRNDVPYQLTAEVVKAHLNSVTVKRTNELESELKTAKEQILALSTPTPASRTVSSLVSPPPTIPPPTISTMPISDVEMDVEMDMGMDEAPETPTVPRTTQMRNTVNAGAQTSFTFPDPSELQGPSVSERAEYLVHARLELERLKPGETTLGLHPSPDANPAPLISEVLKHLRAATGDIDGLHKSHKRMEKHERHLQARLHHSMAQIRSANAQFEQLNAERQEAEAEAVHQESRAEHYKTATNELRDKLQGSRSQLKDLEEENSYLERDKDGLSANLKRYRDQVDDYTNKIMNIEEQYSKKIEGLESQIQQLKSENLDLIRELESRKQLSAQERSALQQTINDWQQRYSRLRDTLQEDHALKCRNLEWKCRELQAVVHQKQHAFRELDDKLDEERLAHLQEVGRMNVRLGRNESDLHDLRLKLSAERQRAWNVIQQFIAQVQVAANETVNQIMESSSPGAQPVQGYVTAVQDIGNEALNELIVVDQVRAMYDDWPATTYDTDLDLDSPNHGDEHVTGRIEIRRGGAAKWRKQFLDRDSGLGTSEGVAGPMNSQPLLSSEFTRSREPSCEI